MRYKPKGIAALHIALVGSFAALCCIALSALMTNK
jgi:hypothetical protein